MAPVSKSWESSHVWFNYEHISRIDRPSFSRANNLMLSVNCLKSAPIALIKAMVLLRKCQP